VKVTESARTKKEFLKSEKLNVAFEYIFLDESIVSALEKKLYLYQNNE
jgi:hypothetical protein